MDIIKKIELLKKNSKNIYTIEELLDYFKEDGIFAILFIINIPSSIPVSWALGFGSVPSGIATLILAFQLIFGFRKPYLPHYIKSHHAPRHLLNNCTFSKPFHHSHIILHIFHFLLY